MLTLLHISDLHFGKPYSPQVGTAVLRSAAELAPDASTFVTRDQPMRHSLRIMQSLAATLQQPASRPQRSKRS